MIKDKKIRKNYSEKLINFETSLPETSDKKERARQNAQNTRKRRRAYIDQLEQQVAQLTEQLKQGKPEQQTGKPGLMQQFLKERKYLFDRLQQSYEENNEIEIKIMVDALRYNYGISGVGRMSAIDYVSNQMVDLLLPMHMRYLFWVASENCDLFERERQSGEYSYDLQDSQVNCIKQFGLNENQMSQIQGMQERIKQQRTIYDNLIIDVYRLNMQIKKESEACQSIIDEIRSILTHQQSAEFLLTLDNNRVEQLKAKKVYPECIIHTLKMQAKQEQCKEASYNEMKMENKHWEDAFLNQMFDINDK